MNSKKCCVHCGEALRPDAKSCWYCGSDYQTAWSDRTYLDGIDLPEDFDYDDALEHEFGSQSRTERRKLPWHRKILVAVATIMLMVMLIGIFRALAP